MQAWSIENYEVPDPSQLTPKQAAQLSYEMRRDLLPNLYRNLSHSMDYSQSGNKNVWSQEALARNNDIELSYSFIQALDRHATHEFPLPSAEKMPIEFSRLRVRDDYFVNARAKLFLCPISRRMVHGPIIAYFASVLTEKILHQDEHISEVVSMRWNEPVFNDIDLFIHDTESSSLNDGMGERSKKPSMQGVFRTTEGRLLHCFGWQVAGNPVLEYAGFNSHTFNIALPWQSSYDRLQANGRIYLNKQGVSSLLSVLPRARPLFIYILLDLLTLALLNFRKKQNLNAQTLLGQVRGVALEPFATTNQQKEQVQFEMSFSSGRGHETVASELNQFRFFSRFLPFQSKGMSGVGVDMYSEDAIIRFMNASAAIYA